MSERLKKKIAKIYRELQSSQMKKLTIYSSRLHRIFVSKGYLKKLKKQ